MCGSLSLELESVALFLSVAEASVWRFLRVCLNGFPGEGSGFVRLPHL